MAIEYTFATTAEMSNEILQKLLMDTVGIADSTEKSSSGELDLVLVYKNLMTVGSFVPNFTAGSPSQTHWKNTLGSRPQTEAIFRFMNGADAEKIHDAMLRFVREFLRTFEDDAVFMHHNPILLRYKGKIFIDQAEAFWVKRFEGLGQPYRLVSHPKPDSDDAAN